MFVHEPFMGPGILASRDPNSHTQEVRVIHIGMILWNAHHSGQAEPFTLKIPEVHKTHRHRQTEMLEYQESSNLTKWFLFGIFSVHKRGSPMRGRKYDIIILS